MKTGQTVGGVRWEYDVLREVFRYKDDAGEWHETRHISWGEVHRDMGRPTVDCVECGQVGELEGQRHRQELEEKQQCFTCHFYLRLGSQPGSIRIDGRHYLDGGHRADLTNSCKGFGGRRYRYRFVNSGLEFSTDNLWYQGRIPEVLRPRMPDNAEFIE